jgi:hypothetical protein
MTIAISELVDLACRRFGVRFGERLCELASTRAAYGGSRMNKKSLRAVLIFLTTNKTWELPELFLVPTGNVQAQWKARDSRIVAQFLHEGEVWFTAIAAGKPRLTGRVHPDQFVAAISAYAPLIS